MNNFTFRVFCGILCSLGLLSCQPEKAGKSTAELKEEIYSTEKQFEAATKSKGIGEAFYLFADDSAVLKRSNDTLIKGKENIKAYFQTAGIKNAEVSWTADFIDVSPDGQLGYTYGNYVWRIANDSGTVNESKGVFHTVWKKQSDGSWKYVWD